MLRYIYKLKKLIFIIIIFAIMIKTKIKKAVVITALAAISATTLG
jgi:hypothetical protein